MEISIFLENLKNLIKEGQKVPFSDKVIINREEAVGMIDEMIFKLPDELKQAEWITKERERIIAEAQKDADEIIKEAEMTIISRIDEHEITKKAYQKKDQLLLEANNKYREMTEATNTYVDGILQNLENNMQELAKTISVLHGNVDSEIQKIEENRKQLK